MDNLKLVQLKKTSNGLEYPGSTSIQSQYRFDHDLTFLFIVKVLRPSGIIFRSNNNIRYFAVLDNKMNNWRIETEPVSLYSVTIVIFICFLMS